MKNPGITINGILKKSAIFALIIALFLVMMPPFCMEAFAAQKVYYYAPVYNIDGDPTSGLNSWSTQSTDSYASINTTRAVLNESVYYLGYSLNYDGSIEIEGNVTLIIGDGVTLKAHQIHVPESSSLTIYGKGSDTSKIEISYGEQDEAAIGGDKNQSCGPITINKCGILINKSRDGAAIGGGCYGTGKNITLNECDTDIPYQSPGARGVESDNAAGIGGGDDRSGEDIVINGGSCYIEKVCCGGAGIGGGRGGTAERIYVRNCCLEIMVYDGGAGIGGGLKDGGGANAKDITVDNIWGYIKSQKLHEYTPSTYVGAAIGGGDGGTAENITVKNCRSDLELVSKGKSAVIGSGDDASANGIIIDNCSLNLETSMGSAPIGAGNDGDAYNINIKNSNIKAKCTSSGGAGIGGGDCGDAENITIENSVIEEASGSDGGAGIGGGDYGTAKNIRIKNSTVKATGGYDASGIGSGRERSAERIYIENSTVTAKGNNDGAGIGGGYKGNGRLIHITDNSDVTARGGSRAAGIGGGYKADGSHMSITDSKVNATCGSKEDNINASGGAGIGAGATGEFAEIDITDSEVYASANGGGGEAIGKGKDGDYALEIRIDSKQIVTLDGTTIDHNGGNLADKFSGKNTAELTCLEKEEGVVPVNPGKRNWYDSAVSYVKDKGLMKGVTDTDFNPLGTASRSMAVTVLWRIAGSPAASYKAEFADTTEGSWFSDALSWAVEKGVIIGNENSDFAPGRAISRQELATMIYRYEKSLGNGFTGTWFFNLPQKDAASVNDWANEAIHWCVMKEIIKGDNKNNLNPRNTATRAEMATIVMNYMKYKESEE